MQYTTLHHATPRCTTLHCTVTLDYATPHQTRSHTTLRHTTPHATCHTTLLYAILYQIAPQNGTLHHCYAARCHITPRYTYPTHRIMWCAADWAKQYGCGENDVVDLNVSDAYWSLYYVTVDRMTAGARLPFMYCLLASVTLSHLAFGLVAYSSLFIAVL
jgi:hypothetical protein